jgi:hypothetical protein
MSSTSNPSHPSHHLRPFFPLIFLALTILSFSSIVLAADFFLSIAFPAPTIITSAGAFGMHSSRTHYYPLIYTIRTVVEGGGIRGGIAGYPKLNF